MKIKKSNTSESTVERRLKRRLYKRNVSLREYSRATDHFDYVFESQFRRKKSWLPFFFSKIDVPLHCLTHCPFQNKGQLMGLN